MNVSVKFEPRDIWLGVFWTRRASAWASERGWLDIYVCLIPCLPVKISWFVGLDCPKHGYGSDDPDASSRLQNPNDTSGLHDWNYQWNREHADDHIRGIEPTDLNSAKQEGE